MADTAHPDLHVIRHPLVHVRLTTLRDRETTSLQFRNALRELASLMVFEATRHFETRSISIRTPLATTEGYLLASPLVVVPILRAGLGMADAIQQLLPEAAIGHIGMFRDETTLSPTSYYYKQPAFLGEAKVLLVDPMLATGHSAAAAISKLKESGAKNITFICLVCCPEGLAVLAQHHSDVPVYTASVDECLNDSGYILPGLGDSGDRYFGTL